MITRYRIATEDKNQEALLAEAAKRFGCFAVYSCVGYWQGARENGLTLEIAVEDLNPSSPKQIDIEAFCAWIAEYNAQEAVLWTKEQVKGAFIYGKSKAA